MLIKVAEAKILLKTNQKISKAVFSALRPEVEHRPSRFVDINMNVEGDAVKLEMKADSFPHFRAAVSSYLRLVKAAICVLEACG